MGKNVFLYRHLDIPYDQNEIAAFLKKRPDIPNLFRIIDDHNKVLAEELPFIKRWIDENNLRLKTFAYISIGPMIRQYIHKDPGLPELALNIPVFNCENIYTVFYEVGDREETLNYTSVTKLPFYSYEGFSPTDPNRILGQYSLIKPTILNVKQAHSVVNTTNQSRICLSFRFEEDPWHLV